MGVLYGGLVPYFVYQFIDGISILVVVIGVVQYTLDGPQALGPEGPGGGTWWRDLVEGPGRGIW
jgi:hypothetical protein